MQSRKHAEGDRSTFGRRTVRLRPGRLLLACGLGLLLTLPALAAREAKGTTAGEGEADASRLLDKANELLASGEDERGVKMLETVLEQYPSSHTRFGAYLALGRHALGAHDQLKAVGFLANLKTLENAAGEVAPEDRDLYLEGLYLMGTSYFQVRNYAAAFPILRKITMTYANTSWANQAYFTIGMCHFAEQNWSKAIEALSLVGTFVDVSAPEAALVEAGRRLYVKVTDLDLSILARLGQQTQVTIETAHGDRETVECVAQGGDGSVLIGSIATEVGVAHPGDHLLQVLGGDTITLRYTDANTQDGATNVVREAKVRVVSTGTVGFTLGDHETPAAAAYLGQPLFVALQDADLDTSDAAESVTLKMVARYKPLEEESAPGGAVDLKKVLAEGTENEYRVRDETTVRLVENGPAPTHSGRFTGQIQIRAAQPDQPVTPMEGALTCAVGDEIVVTYTDERHLDGDAPRTVTATIRVVGEIDNRPSASQDVVADPVVRARKNLVEATAYLELARIFKSMGLMAGARQKAADGLERVDGVIRATGPMPRDLKQQAIKTRWELYLAEDDFARAIGTCTLFNRLYPDSPLVDEALMGVAKIRLENKEYDQAIGVLRQVLALPQSQARAEAQFRIAEATEAEDMKRGGRNRESAMEQYRLCATRYPESSYAGQSLAKLVDYHVENRNFGQAGELLEQVFQDHPDAPFLDAMLLKWVLVAYNSGDYAKAREKCAQLLMEYPGSACAAKARAVLPKIEAKLKPEAGGAAAGKKVP